MITANCRTRLTADDFDTIVRILAVRKSDQVGLTELLTDADVRDDILDHPALAEAILNSPGRLPISPHLLFYVLCRRVLREAGIRSRDSADYVASVLEAFSRTARVYDAQGSEEQRHRYFCDMLEALSRASDREAFLLRSHMANYSLFLSGIFAENLAKRHHRGAPDISFYEKMGRMNYRVAAEYRDAKRLALTEVYEELSRCFHEVRLALNDLASRLLHFDPAPPVFLPAH